MKVRYEFDMGSGDRHEFVIDIDRASSATSSGGAPWTQLGYKQCPNCPLKTESSPTCPAARDLERVVGAFTEVVAYQSALVHVHVHGRVVSKDTDIESALVALLGLVMASSGCPVLARLKGMARMHMPFQLPEEAMLRFVGSYLVGQLLAMQRRERPDWSLEKLDALFEDLITVNESLRERLREAAIQDSAAGAIMNLATQTMSNRFTAQGQLDKLKDYVVPLTDDPQ